MKVKSAVIIIRYEELYLLLERHTHDHNVSGWCLPGGKLDKKESEADAVIRETEEETGLKLSAEDIKFIGKYESTLKSRTTGEEVKEVEVSVFEVTLETCPIIKISEEHYDFAWFDFDEVKLMQDRGELAGKTWVAFNL